MVRKGAPALVSGSDLYAVRLSEISCTGKHLDALKNGHRIVQGAERVDADVESEVCELSSDAVGKAASEHHDLVFI